ncbi:MAG TPA: DJ-1/PfpI family protein [Thermoanaerobaculia bacterium]|jgi:putative intracellular protease/amidase/YHS domain-containing protein
MRRREFLKTSAAVGFAAAVPNASVWLGRISGPSTSKKTANTADNPVRPLKAPATGPIPVAFVVSEGAVLIDFAGPWEVFQDVMVPGRGTSMEDQMPFRLFTVSADTKPIRISGGLQIVPDYAFADAPAPSVIVIPAQKGSPQHEEWVRTASKSTDVTMSVCTGAFLLARTGLLSGRSATTHHSSYRTLAMQFPDVRVKRGVRFVDEGPVASAGGLSSGMDLALHVVERYFGRDVATETAYQLEYQGPGWLNPASNAVYLQARKADGKSYCPVCDMEVDPATAPKSAFQGKSYFFCSGEHKEMFDSAPAKFLEP